MAVQSLGFDVYGTLVDPLEMQTHLGQVIGAHAERFSQLWREKQLEYAFRRGLMRAYEDFGVCTRQALEYTMLALDIALSDEDQQQILDAYQHLDPFSDVIPGITALASQGHTIVGFSNGLEATVRRLLDHAGILAYLDDVISVDDLKTFKPDPEVYHYLARRLGTPMSATWLVSSNPWDVIGAKAAGLSAAWVKRMPDAVFDPWGIQPDLVVHDLNELAVQFQRMA